MVNENTLKQCIDFSLVGPQVSQREIEDFLRRALINRVRTIYVPPIFISFAVSKAAQKGIKVGTTAGFPYGNMPLELKEAGIVWAAKEGARWTDVCLNISLIRSGMFDEVEKEIERLNIIAHRNNTGLKLIVESPYLNKEELIRVVKLIDNYQVDYLKTASGVSNKVSETEIEIIKPLLTYSKLKVAGGITSLAQTERFLELGADRIGTSNGFQILAEAQNNGV